MKTRILLGLGLISLLTACDGGDLELGQPGVTGSGELSLYVTDAPIDYADRVVLVFTGVVLQPVQGDPIAIDIDPPRAIDLLGLQGGGRALLLDEVEVPAGEYEGLRLLVQAESQTLDSYVGFTDGRQESLFVPRGPDFGLSLPVVFVVPFDGLARFVIDFDLRRGLIDAIGTPDYELRPFLRFADEADTGVLTGTIPGSFITDPACGDDLLQRTGNAVYLFGEDSTEFDDFDGRNDAYASAPVVLDPRTGLYTYYVDLLPAGRYRIAFTCQAADDFPDRDDLIDFTPGGFFNVDPGITTEFDFSGVVLTGDAAEVGFD